MNDLEQEDPLSDTSLDREIVQALAVEPSPAFLARVRTAVGEEPARGSWHWSWAWVGIGSAAVAIVVAFAVVPVPQLELPPVPNPPTAVASSVLPAPAELPVGHPGESTLGRPAPRPGGQKATVPKGPEVLIAQDESAALKRLMQGGRQRLVEFSTLDDAPDGTQAGEPPTKIVVSLISAIPPISIEPLGLEEGQDQ